MLAMCNQSFGFFECTIIFLPFWRCKLLLLLWCMWACLVRKDALYVTMGVFCRRGRGLTCHKRSPRESGVRLGIVHYRTLTRSQTQT